MDTNPGLTFNAICTVKVADPLTVLVSNSRFRTLTPDFDICVMGLVVRTEVPKDTPANTSVEAEPAVL
jgi:hypothetical protein